MITDQLLTEVAALSMLSVWHLLDQNDVDISTSPLRTALSVKIRNSYCGSCVSITQG
jgi:hypothetical protein